MIPSMFLLASPCFISSRLHSFPSLLSPGSSSCLGLSKKKNSSARKKKMFCTFWFASAYICLGLINFLWVQRSEFIIYFISLKRVDNRFFAFLGCARATCSCCCRSCSLSLSLGALFFAKSQRQSIRKCIWSLRDPIEIFLFSMSHAHFVAGSRGLYLVI